MDESNWWELGDGMRARLRASASEAAFVDAMRDAMVSGTGFVKWRDGSASTVPAKLQQIGGGTSNEQACGAIGNELREALSKLPQTDLHAHAMSHPQAQTVCPACEGWPCWCADKFPKREPVITERRERKHVSDAAWEAYLCVFRGVGREDDAELDRDSEEEWHVKMGTVLLTVAEHDALLRMLRYHETMQDKHGALIEAHNELIARYERIDDSERALRAEVERLTARLEWRGDGWDGIACRDETIRMQDELIERLRKGRKDEQAGANGAVGDVRRTVCVSGAQGILAAADNLDPRLGLPQPEGEPCQPMSAKSWRRRMG